MEPSRPSAETHDSPESLGIDERHGRRGFVDGPSGRSQARIIDSFSVDDSTYNLEKAPRRLAPAGRVCAFPLGESSSELESG